MYERTPIIFSKRWRLALMDTKEEIQIKFGKAIKLLIEEKGMSIHKLAAAAGLEYAHVQRITAGKVNLELSTIIALCRGLRISSDRFFFVYESI
ncbi:helix-turn-helix domain-containing protein [Taibaiella chishuiensis]|uniref:Helix-turn-helix protein n=1 Tax=Taibaiella chishuiensis TaxID=1434707 RepID=A0A2P8D0U6_9BACT|nr:helix-turn-helix transcriptional regulator [Taibaiella chishuiensis]PSK90838.1 helix-turn-helix protein [Taibaiella chishuiensis]